MKIRYIAAILLLFAILIACSEEVDQFPELSKEVVQYPDLSKRIPYFMERLHSNRWQVRYCLIDDLKKRDAETKHLLEVLIRNENKRIGIHALRRYLHIFIDINKTLFKPELYFWGIVGDRFLAGGIPNEERYDALVDSCLRRLDPTQLDNPRMYDNLTVVGILGKPGDAEALYPFLQSTNSYVAICAIKAVIRIGDRKKGIETLRRLASWDTSKDPPYLYWALIALKELQDPELKTIVSDGLVSIAVREFHLIGSTVSS